MNFYVFAITHSDQCCFTKRPLRAKSPEHAEAKFLGKMGCKGGRNERNFAETVKRWGHRDKRGAKNLLKKKPPYLDLFKEKP